MWTVGILCGRDLGFQEIKQIKKGLKRTSPDSNLRSDDAIRLHNICSCCPEKTQVVPVPRAAAEATFGLKSHRQQ